MDAAKIAGLHYLRLIRETITALAYGIFKTDLPENDPLNVDFINVWHADQCSNLERVKKPLEKALAEAGVTLENIRAVEVVGSGSRVPAIIKILTEFFGKEPSRTMNTSECVAKGSALVCFILGPTIKVREFQLLEEEEVEVLVVKESAKEPAKMETDEASLDPAPSSTTETNMSMQDAKGSVELLVETPKKKVKKTSVPVSELVYGGMATIDLPKSMEMEVEIALQDRVIAKLEELQKVGVSAMLYLFKLGRWMY
ncbi:heat shock 70 kDa 15-like [Olea europaea subsp. europaea]|uniref:Heat shock 70 kDa 15-like n=1 Tax=Olea europaea subsp. europaea TaxID=158383 RepID=A0A8S0QFT1_OLEEU|nr:heat shock 70 kDa 15-like [Olea europaea subsp. europaea]